MKVIYKYELKLQDEQDILMPSMARILDVQKQNDRLCLWAIVDPRTKACKRRIFIKGTGHELSDAITFGSVKYIATVQDYNFVWHVFDGGEYATSTSL